MADWYWPNVPGVNGATGTPGVISTTGTSGVISTTGTPGANVTGAPYVAGANVTGAPYVAGPRYAAHIGARLISQVKIGGVTFSEVDGRMMRFDAVQVDPVRIKLGDYIEFYGEICRVDSIRFVNDPLRWYFANRAGAEVNHAGRLTKYIPI